MTYLEFYNIATEGGELLKRLKVAVIFWALEVAQSVPTTTLEEDPKREAKIALAREVTKDAEGASLRVIWFVLAGQELNNNGENLSDAALQGIVSGLLNTYAAEAMELPRLDVLLK